MKWSPTIGPDLYIWVGVSTATKPTAGILAGQRAFETDTQDEYKWWGNAWVKVSSKGASNVVIQDPTTGDVARVKENANTNSNELLVNLEGHECPENSTTAQLGADAVFTGSGWQDTLDYGVLSVNITTDQNSATDGLEIQWSDDGISVNDYDYFTILANQSKTFTFGPANRYYRIKYTNGSGGTTTTLSITSLVRRVYVKPSSHRINDSIVGEDDAELVKSVLTGLAPDGAFKNVQVTNAGNQKISIEEFDGAVSSTMDSFSDNIDGETGLLVAAGIYGRVSDTILAPISIDSSTHAINAITYEHHEIHGGSHYNYCDYLAATGSGTVIEFIFTTPNTTKWVHLTFDVFSATGATIQLYEGTSGITGGTPITPRNNNRNSSNTSDVTLLKDPSAITSDGARAAGFLAGAGRNSGFVARDKEYILAQNQTYMVRITSTAASNAISWCAEWYEHTDKN